MATCGKILTFFMVLLLIPAVQTPRLTFKDTDLATCPPGTYLRSSCAATEETECPPGSLDLQEPGGADGDCQCDMCPRQGQALTQDEADYLTQQQKTSIKLQRRRGQQETRRKHFGTYRL